MISAWIGKNVVIVGAARQGVALAGYLLAQGARVTLTDKRPLSELESAQQALALLSPQAASVRWVCGDHPLTLLEDADLLCLSGGVSPMLPLVISAQERGIALSNDSQIFMEIVPCKVIGITGSAGKTTTTTLVGRIAQAAIERPQARPSAYRKVWVGGNIGTPLISVVDEIKPDDLCVMELSSFQLELMTRSPQVAVILNITPNHLDRHGTMQAYTAAKARILQFQSPDDQAVLGRDDPGAASLRKMAPGTVSSFGFSDLPDNQPGVYQSGDAIYLCRHALRRPDAQPTLILHAQEIALRGAHNLLNVMAACATAAAADLPAEAMRSGVIGFAGVPHRLEFVRSWGGADWYNDSIATAPERSMAALRSFEEPLVLLAGGRDKNLPWDDFATQVRRRVDHLIVFGEAAEIILRAIEKDSVTTNPILQSVTRCKGLQDAVQAAAQIVQPGDVVLLSPGGTSFDEFKDFEERGECFAQWVKNLP